MVPCLPGEGPDWSPIGFGDDVPPGGEGTGQPLEWRTTSVVPRPRGTT
jgi:hypothetical protein